jgi:hypothetical protein
MLDMGSKGIDSIFGKDPQGRYYNNRARLYQDILIFGSTLEEEESFKLWDLAKFLLNKNDEFRNRYIGEKIKNPKRVEYVQKRIRRYVDSLVNLRLMKQTGEVKEEKGTGLIPTFSYTPAGYIFSRIIQCIGSKKGNTEEELYNFLHERLYNIKEDSLSFVIFASNLIKKIYEKGLFGNYISNLQKVLDSKDIPNIEAFARRLQQTLSVTFQTRLFVNAWEDTINELEPEIRKLFLYDQKLNIDIKMGAKAMSKEYEKLRLELIGETERIALEGFCSECRRRYVFPMKIMEYTRRLANAHLITLAIRCPKCKANQRTLQLPNLWS